VLEGFSPVWSATKLESLLHELKTSLGCGGKIENRTLELQGELADRLIPLWDTIAPGFEAAERTPGREGDPTPDERGWLHCGQKVKLCHVHRMRLCRS
jgi:6-phosphogluconate dehydrogenase